MEKTVDDEIKEEVKRRLEGKVDVQLGKRGVSESFIREVRNRLDKKGVVKIRVLKSYLKTDGSDVESLAELIASRTGGVIRDVRGHTFILEKERKGG